ncbi:MAG TPA: FtsH protease activity modulator HflK [Stellaceae bacterium]
MTWNQGGGGGGGGPWGGGKSPWGGGGRGPRPPNLEEIFRRGQDRMRRLLPGGWGSGPGILFVVLALVVIWGVSGFYIVQPDEEGIVLRFGAYNRKATPGLNYHWPVPIEHALTPKVTRANIIEIGGTPRESVGRGVDQEPAESRMLTGDENLLDVYFTVQWQIKDAPKYLFNIRNPQDTVKAVAESAMREVIGRTEAIRAIVGGQDAVVKEMQDLLQQILDSYDSGIQITSINLRRIDLPSPDVIAAFTDVQTAKTERDSKVIQARKYLNSIVPQANGDAAQIKQQAEAYRQQVVKAAEGDASRFLAVYQSYKAAEDVTARRLYIETMEDVLKGANKVILDKAAAGAGVLPFLPLPSLNPKGGGGRASGSAAPPSASASPHGGQQ